MLEERERAYKQGLTERIGRRIPSGERVQAVAICQVGPPPWVGVVPLLLGIAVVAVSLFVGGIPVLAGAIGALMVLGGIAMLATVRRRLLARTNRSLHVFALPRSQKASFEDPIVSVAVSELPAYEGASVRVGGERLWPNYGSGIERDALAEALAAE